jgi:hypothetical protein
VGGFEGVGLGSGGFLEGGMLLAGWTLGDVS